MLYIMSDDYDGYKNKFAKHRNDKKNWKNTKKIATKNKMSFMDEDSYNINDIPQSILDEKKKQEEIIMNKKREDHEKYIQEELNRNNNINNENEEDITEEEFTPDYFEPIPYIKK